MSSILHNCTVVGVGSWGKTQHKVIFSVFVVAYMENDILIDVSNVDEIRALARSV